MADGTREFAQTWTFGAAGGPGSNLGSTGAGAAVNTFDLGERFTFLAESDASATGAYQIRTARTAAGPWAVLSSGTLDASVVQVVQAYGPLGFLSPRIKTLNSTANRIIVRGAAI
jgi:hypothetical protein